MAKSRYYPLRDGEWIAVKKRGFRDQCCDCGLVHVVDFRIVGTAIEMRTRRDGRMTGGARSRRKRRRYGKA